MNLPITNNIKWHYAYAAQAARAKITKLLNKTSNQPVGIKTKVRDSKIFLCKYQGKSIFLPLPKLKNGTQLYVLCFRKNNNIYAAIVPHGSWRKKGEVQPTKLFLVKEGKKTFYTAKDITNNEADQTEKAKEPESPLSRLRREGKDIISWWQDKTDEIPGPFERKVNRDGKINLGSYKGLATFLGIGGKHIGKTVTISFQEREGCKIVVAELLTVVITANLMPTGTTHEISRENRQEQS